MSITSEAPGRFPIAVVIGAQIALLAGIGLYALSGDWTASPNGLITVIGGALILVVATLIWWRWGSRAPLVVADMWLAIYGLTVLFLYGVVDVGEGPISALPMVLGLLWLVAGLVGAVAVWRFRR